MLFALQIVALPWTGADLASLKVGNVWLYIPISLIGICLYWLIANIVKKSTVIEYLGVNSLVIFAFQEPVYRAVIFVTSKLIGWTVEDVRTNLWLCIAIAVCSVIAIVPCIYCWNKWAKPLIKRI